MRVVTWNCKGALRRKISYVDPFNPDILIVPESECLDSLPAELGGRVPNTIIWQGHTPRKGLAVIAYGGYHIQLHPQFTPEHKWILPIIVSGPTSFLLMAVWTLPAEDTRSYVLPLLMAHESYRDLFCDLPVMWAGDFNANFIFNHSQYKFRDFVNLLESDKIISLYHAQTNTRHGEESDKTFFHYHHREKGYHIDYFFACHRLRKDGFHITLGSPDEWLDKSDHLPVICDI